MPKVATVSLWAALVAGVVFAGAPRPPESALWALGLGLALGWVWLRGGRISVAGAPLAAPALVVGALSLMQLVPLPHGLRALLSSESTRLVDLVLGEGGRSWRPLAVDPALTWQATARVFGAAAAALLAAEVASRSDGRRQLRAGLVALMVLVVLLGVMTVSGWHLPWLPVVSSRLSAPLRNANHLGALLAATLPLIWSLAARAVDSGSDRRFGYFLLGGAANVALFATASRSAVVLGVLVQLVVLATLWREGGRVRGTAVAVAVALVLAGVVGGAGLWSRLRDEVVNEVGAAVPRGTVWAAAAPVFRAHALVGIGRGALPEVLPRYTPIAAHQRYDFIENELWQLGIDLGMLGLLAVAAALWCALRLVRQRRKSGAGRAALWGLLAFALSNLVDFGWELPLLATVAAMLAALGAESVPTARRPWMPLLAALAAVITSALALGPLGRAAEHEPGPPCAPATLARHPLDGDVPLKCLASGASVDPPRELDRALLLLPYDGRSHALAARLLFAAGQKDQAALEARLSLEQTQWLLLDGRVNEVLALFGDDDDRAATAIPDQPLSVLRLAVARLASAKRPALAATLAARLLVLEPQHVGAAQISLDSAAQRRDTNAAVAAARALLAADPTASSAERVAAVLPALGARDDAFRLLTEPPTHAISVTPRARAAVMVAVAEPPAPSLWPRAREVAEAALAQAVLLDDKAQLHEALASLYERQQEPAKAGAARREAARLRGR